VWNGKSGKGRHSQEFPFEKPNVINANENLEGKRIKKLKFTLIFLF
jgi:hypothetical protein